MPAKRSRHRAQRKHTLHPQPWLIRLGLVQGGDYVSLHDQYREYLKAMVRDKDLGDKAKEFLAKHRRGDFNQIFRRWADFIAKNPFPPDYGDGNPDAAVGPPALLQAMASNAAPVQPQLPPRQAWDVTILTLEEKKSIIATCSLYITTWLSEAYSPIYRDYGNRYWEPLIEREWEENIGALSLLITVTVLKDIVKQDEEMTLRIFKKGRHTIFPLLVKLDEMRRMSDDKDEKWEDIDKFKKYVNAVIGLGLLLKDPPRQWDNFRSLIRSKAHIQF